jgi:hypothetical protein
VWRRDKNDMALLINVTGGMWMTHHLVIDTLVETNLRCEEFAWVREIRWNEIKTCIFNVYKTSNKTSEQEKQKKNDWFALCT